MDRLQRADRDVLFLLDAAFSGGQVKDDPASTNPTPAISEADEKSAREYVKQHDYSECLSSRFQKTEFGECFGPPCNCTTFDAYTSGILHERKRNLEKTRQFTEMMEMRDEQAKEIIRVMREALENHRDAWHDTNYQGPEDQYPCLAECVLTCSALAKVAELERPKEQ